VRATGRHTTLVRWLKFTAVGGIGIAVQLSALALLESGFHLDYLLATSLAVQAAVTHNFIWHERFTWADRPARAIFARFLKFNCTTGAFSIAGNLGMMKLLVGRAHLNDSVASLLAVAACSLLNFLVSDRFVFREATKAQGMPGVFPS
jgi:putative flippase GtrA